MPGLGLVLSDLQCRDGQLTLPHFSLVRVDLAFNQYSMHILTLVINNSQDMLVFYVNLIHPILLFIHLRKASLKMLKYPFH